MKRLLLTTMMILAAMTVHSKGIITSPHKLGVVVENGEMSFTEQTMQEIVEIRAHNPFGKLNVDLTKNRTTYGHLDKAYKNLYQIIKNKGEK
jgi:hypothetical protein